MLDIMELTGIVRKTSFAIHKYFKNGFLEKIYEKALFYRLQKTGIEVKCQYPIKVFDEDGTLLGDYFADIFVENRLIVEIKACSTIVDEHIAQLLGYLKASKIEHGLLINFGAPKLQIKKYILN